MTPTHTAPDAAPIAEEIPALGPRDLLTVGQLTRGEVESLWRLAASLKRDATPYAGALAGRAVVLLFEKDSLRTKVSFEVGIAKLGGHAVYHNHQDCRIGERESVADYARNLSRYADAIVARVYGQGVLDELAAASDVPVINALSERYHPCQALSDLFTLREALARRGRGLAGAGVAYVGDGNNVCHSLMLACALLGVRVTVVSPEGYGPDAEVLGAARELGNASGAGVEVSTDLDAVAGHDAVYTDAWVSMGFEAESARRNVAFAGYQVTERLLEHADDGEPGRALFMHCLPAHRGFEVAEAVIDGPRSIVFDQAENRMHVQNALMIALLRGVGGPAAPAAGA